MSIGVALALVRDVIERIIPHPKPVDLQTIRAEALAAGLLALGLEPGDRVGIWAPNCIEWLLVQLGSARVAIMSSDLLQSPQAIAALLDDVHSRKIDILVGTQIMAKGYHFPEMTLVGIVDADLGLSGGDPRAAERSFQLLQQVAGRTGRASKAGRAYLQTYQPEHPVMQALATGRRADFIAAELREREAYALPPYRRLAALILSGTDAQKVDRAAASISRYAPQDDRLRLLGPAPAPLALLRGQHRRRLLLIAAREINIQSVLHTWLNQINLPKDLNLHIDIDPYSFY